MAGCRVTVALFSLWAAVALPVGAAEFCVGSGAFATHPTLPAAVAAAAANGPGLDTIRLDTIAINVPNTVLIENHAVDIVGGFVQCQPLAPTGITTVNGAGGTAGSVIELRNTNGGLRTSSLDRVTITGGEDDNSGGGVDVRGAGLLVNLGANVTIHSNTAANGGGVYVANASLGLQGAMIRNNTATSQGGGVYCASGVINVSRATSVRLNTAPGGGGYSVRSVCEASFFGGSGTSVFANSVAGSGGGILAGDSSLIRVFRGDGVPGAPIGRSGAFSVTANTAGVTGAGIALISNARLEARGVVIVGNNLSVTSVGPVEPLGGGLFAGTGTSVQIYPDAQCLAGESCNLIASNAINRSANSLSSAGAGLAAVGATLIDIDNLEISGNSVSGGATSAIAVVGANIANAFLMTRALIHHNSPSDNSAAASVMRIAGAPSVRFHYLTIADNTLAGPSPVVVRANAVDTLAWRSSIVDEAGDVTAALTVAIQPVIDCLLATELPSVGTTTRSLAGSAQFVDRNASDYRPTLGANQIDFCDGPPSAIAGTPLIDLDLAPVPRDSITVDLYGPYDLGAYESQSGIIVDNIFRNSFEIPQ